MFNTVNRIDLSIGNLSRKKRLHGDVKPRKLKFRIMVITLKY